MSLLVRRESAYHHGDLRRELLALGQEVVLRGEVDRLSMRWLTTRAGVSPAAAYHHFKDRTALLWALAEQGFDELHSRLQQRLSANSGDPVVDLGLAYVGFARERLPLYRLMMKACTDESFRAYRADLEASRCLGLLRSTIGSVLGDQSNSENVSAISLAVWAALHGVSDLHLESAGKPEPTLALVLCRRLLHGLLPSAHELSSLEI